MRTKQKNQRPLNAIKVCRYCGGTVRLADAKAIYGKQGNGKIYLCTNCNACVGVFVGTYRPKGVLANSALRSKRIETHVVFNEFYKQRGMTRTEAYKWLAQKLRLPEHLAHIGQFEMDKCAQLIQLCQNSKEKKS